MFSYRSLLKQALSISWRNKYLWFFGLFAALLAGSGGSWEYQIFHQNVNSNLIDNSYNYLGGILAVGDFVKSFILGLANLFRYDFLTAVSVLTLLLIIIFLFVSFIWLAVSSQGALIDNVKKLFSKKKPTLLSVRRGLEEGHNHFWPVLGLNILIKVIVCASFFIIGLPLLFMVFGNNGLLNALYIILFVIFVPVGAGLTLLVKYSIAYNVLDKHSFVKSLAAGKKLFIKHWLISLEMAVILFLIEFAASGAILLLIAIFLLPLILLGILFKLGGLIVFAILLAIVLIIVAGSWLTTFQTATWTGLFLNLKENTAVAKLERLFNRR